MEEILEVHRPAEPKSPRQAQGQGGKRNEEIYDVCGNICETGDRFAEQRPLPEIREGDLLAIANAGAYCYSMGGIYNLRAMPAEAVVKGGRLISFRRRESDSELIDNILNHTESCDTAL